MLRTTAATAARTPETATAAMITVSALTPSSRAVRKSIDAARICRPIDVRFRSSASKPSDTTPAPMATNDHPADVQRPDRDRLVEPRQRSDRVSDDSLLAVRVLDQRGVLEQEGQREGGDEHGRGVGRPQRSERDPLHQERRDDGGEHGGEDTRCVGPGVRERERVGGDHDQLAVGEVDQPEHAEHEPDPDGDEREDGAKAERVDEVLDVDHEARYAATMRSVSFGVGRGQGHAQLAVRHDVRAVGERDGALRALLDEQHGHAAVANLRQRVEDDVHDRRGEPERRLVQEQDGRACHERACDRELLLLSTREHAGLPRPELRHDRKQLLDPPAVLLDAVAAVAADEPEAQVLLDRQLREDPAAFRDERDARPRDRLRLPTDDRRTGEEDVARPGPDETRDRVQRRRLPGAVRDRSGRRSRLCPR